MNEFEEQDFEEVDIMSGDKDNGFLENDNLSQGSNGSACLLDILSPVFFEFGRLMLSLCLTMI